MCQPSNSLNSNERKTEVVIVGAGPAGLLSAINILRRNLNHVKYNVTLIDTSSDYGVLTAEELKRYRSWMIGLSVHGLTSIKKVPGLYEDYVSEVGVALKSNCIHMGSKEIHVSADDFGEGYIVDRNFICAALARYLNDNFLSDECFQSMYDTNVLYVDGENKRLLTRNSGDKTSKEIYVDYDLLIGCDGVRSCVRGAFVKTHRDFECDVGDIFSKFKAVHVTRPKSVKESSLHLFPNGLPNMNGIGLPETGNKLNISFGYYLNNPCQEALLSNDVEVVADYIKKNLKLELDDYNDFAKQWVDQKWSTTGQVHCNFYHSLELNTLLMGDAAHATSPSIGMGMNTALADAAALDELMNQYKDDLDKVLPAFSEERVKEGNSLTYLAFYAYSMTVSQNIWMQVRQMTRFFFHKSFPSLVMEEPLQLMAKGKKLSEVYDAMMQLGRLQAVRAVNDGIRLKYFERTTGMVTHKKSWLTTYIPWISIVGGCSFVIHKSFY